MYERTDISNFGTITKNSLKPRKWIGFILKLFYTTLSSRASCVRFVSRRIVLGESYDQRRNTYLSSETQDGTAVESFSQPLVPIAEKWKMANIAAVAGHAEMQLLDSDYKPKNILITGGAGFIASHVVLLMVKKYPQLKIVNFDRLDYCSCLENLDEIKNYPNYKFVKGNICSSELVNYVLEAEKIDTIMHFAAQTHVDNSFGNSFQFTQNNIMGTHVLLESAKIAKISRFIHVSTDEVYGEQTLDQEAMSEEQVLEPTNPYAATKAGAEFLAKSYQRSFGMPIIITRGNNVYGPHQYPEKLIPKFINQLTRGRQVTLHGSGANKRNFLFVEDVARAFEIILFKAKVGVVYNIGGSNERANIDVAKDLIGLAGYKAKETEMMAFVEDRVFNDLRYHINSDRMFELGWREQMTWEQGLKLTFDWYLKYNHRYSDIESALVAHPRAGLDPSAKF